LRLRKKSFTNESAMVVGRIQSGDNLFKGPMEAMEISARSLNFVRRPQVREWQLALSAQFYNRRSLFGDVFLQFFLQNI
jgi:hypothetical protein